MKKKFIQLLLLINVMCTVVYAQFHSSQKDVVTVNFAKTLMDSSFVVLEGYAIKQSGSSSTYLFRDETGYISVEINNDNFKNIEVTPKTKIRIYGAVHLTWTMRTINVARLEVVEN